MATQDQMKDEQDEFAAAFNEDSAPAAQMSDDEAFGLADPVPASPAAEDGAEGQAADADVAIVVDADEVEKAAGDAMAKDTAEAAAEPAGEAEVVSDEGDAGEVKPPVVDMEKEVQRLKSWEGRLKAMEAKLKAAGADQPDEQKAAVSDAIEQAADAADTPAEAESVEQIAEQVEDGTITPEQAMKQLAEDFGEDFVKMIEAIAVAKAKEAGGAAASERFGELSKTVDEVIADIVDTKARSHFEMIADRHPDFQDVGASEEFKAYVEALPEGQKAQAMQVIANGSAKQIIKLLDGFKSSATAAPSEELTQAAGESIVDEATEEQMDAAEGVRSSGMKLPEQPKSGGYEDAWSEF
jgi:hypothetical protein